MTVQSKLTFKEVNNSEDWGVNAYNDVIVRKTSKVIENYEQLQLHYLATIGIPPASTRYIYVYSDRHTHTPIYIYIIYQYDHMRRTINTGFPRIFILFRVKWNVQNDCRSKGSIVTIIFYSLPYPFSKRHILYRSVVIFGQCI